MLKKKKLNEIDECLYSHFNIENGRKHATFLVYYDYFKKGKNATETQKKIVQCMDKVL